MKKIIIVLLTVFLNIGLSSCTSDDFMDELQLPQACCGEEGDIPPPPPPPPGGGN